MLCQQTLPKRWFANVNMTSYCDVTTSVYPVTMTTKYHCSILEFGWDHIIKKSPRASPDLCTPLSDTFTSCYTRNGNIKAELKTTEKWVTVTSPDDLFKRGIDVDYKQVSCGKILNN